MGHPSFDVWMIEVCVATGLSLEDLRLDQWRWLYLRGYSAETAVLEQEIRHVRYAPQDAARDAT